MAKRITLGELAEAAHLSRATVSMALRDLPEIAAATRARVQELAARMGYRPDPALSALASMRWQGRTPAPTGRKLALVTSMEPGRKWGVVDGVVKAAARRGYGLETFDRHQFASGQALSRVLYHRGIRGVFVGLVVDGAPPLDLEWDLFSVVALSWPEHPCPFHSVATDMFAAVELSFRETRRHGYRRIGIAPFQSVPAVSYDPLRIAAARYVQSEVRPKSERIPPLTSRSNDRKAFLKWVARYRPDAVIALSPGKIWMLREGGYRVPEDIGYASILHAVAGECAGCGEVRTEECEAAIDLIDAQLRHGRRGVPDVAQMLLVEPRWVDGPTLRQRILTAPRSMD